ncbi:energy-coupling factor transporter ATPase [Acetivibrio clariflavus]|uniref:Energy-coupling factor transporter ATP-binding protein EcfA2 n=1 Tax=Acetivibrio clariflavus (strain DSM 19732 / NBRC 101661 / EBR45) TaxID=720554 RepID=G8M2E0_ACECE|nr:energy-coupling factor transporter ATPase [Acetivibrio clariflavus]AEV70310.1 ABC-type cobalt transport system, ATPase component [Acetivibrio clariflavus DSM 19732]HOQ01344.1 energy-coupling factor transporter ATPase [Acetivibrio clariflavus]HPU40875.1 energy-coupling factor transporter ATPase [Acetivibrio clariflavus]
MTIKIENLSYVYMKGTPFEKKALDNINLVINDGELLGIIGHTGSGKSTLVQHMNGILKPTSGKIYIDGIDISEKKAKELRNQVGIVFQYPEHQLFEETVFKDIAFGLEKRGLKEDEIEVKVKKALKMVELSEEILSKSPFELSGGQKRRVAIAGVLVLEPRILVLDEPTAGLDPRGRDAVYELILNLHKQLNITVILVSHSMEDIARIAKRIIVMNSGNIEMDGTIEQVFKQHERLEQIGLSVPQITYLMRRLKRYVPEISDDIFTIADAKEEIIKFLTKRNIKQNN